MMKYSYPSRSLDTINTYVQLGLKIDSPRKYISDSDRVMVSAAPALPELPERKSFQKGMPVIKHKSNATATNTHIGKS